MLHQQYTEFLQDQSQQLMSMRKSEANEAEKAHLVSKFSKSLLGAPEIRREIEPLVAFLVIFAKSQETTTQ